MLHAILAPWRGPVCALALAAIIAVPMHAQNHPDNVAKSDPAIQRDFAQTPDSLIMPEFVQTPIQVRNPISVQKPDFARYLGRPDGSMPLVQDWSNGHVVYTAGYRDDQADRMARDPRAYSSFLAHGILSRPHFRPPAFRFRPLQLETLHRDWAISLGGGGAFSGETAPSKYVFDVNAPPSCTNDFVVFPVAANSGSTRATVVGTFTSDPTAGQSTSITITPAGLSTVTLTMTAGAANSGTTFAVGGGASSDATDLAAAINRNLSSAALDELAAVASGGTVTVYALTAGAAETLATPATGNPLSNFSWGAPTAGTNGTQANIVGLNNLYTGTTSSSCSGYSYPTFTFSYAAGTGGVVTSPVISLDGTKIAFIESYAGSTTVGAVLHVLTLGTGTEYGSCTNDGLSAPSCATAPVAPGSSSGSTAVDYMVPLQLLGGAPLTYDYISSPFVDYASDVLYVGDAAGYMYSVSPVFGPGTPSLNSNFNGGAPVLVSPFTYVPGNDYTPTALSSVVVDVANTGNIFAGDLGGNLYNVNSSGVVEGSTTIGSTTGFGVFDGPIVDSTNAVGYAAAGCNGTSGDSEIFQFSVASTGSPAIVEEVPLSASGCSVGHALYDPVPDNNYYTKGISSGTASLNGELLFAYADSPNSALAQLQFTNSQMSTTAQFTVTDGGAFAANLGFSPLTEFYGDDQTYSISGISQSGTLVTVTTSSNLFVSNQVVVISGVAAGLGGCTAEAANDINGEQSITVVNATTFTFNSPLPTNIAGGSCTLGSALANGPTQDYLFIGNWNPGVYTFDLPLQSDSDTAIANNTTSVATDGTSGIVVDNDSDSGQASSIYFMTRAPSSSICGATSAYCAVKLTQGALN